MNGMTSPGPGRRGSTLSVVLPLTLMLSVLALTVISLGLTGVRLSTQRQRSAQAFELAEAGFTQSVRSLSENTNYSGQGTTNLGEGSFQTTVTTSATNSNIRNIVSTGHVATVHGGYIERTLTGEADFQSGIFDYGIIVNKDGKVTGSTDISSSPQANKGDVHSNGDLSIGGSSVIHGKATAVGTVTNNGTVTGGIQSNANPVPFPTYDTAALLAEAQAKGITTGDVSSSSGTTVLGGEIVGNLKTTSSAQITIDGILWVTGNVNLSGQSYGGNGILVCEGTISLSGGSGFTGSETNSLLIITLSSASPALTVGGGATVRAAVYVPNGGTKISGTSMIYGAVATKTLDLTGGLDLIRDTNFHTGQDLATGPRVRYWQEQ